MGQSYTVFLERGGGYRIRCNAEKGAIRAAHPYNAIYRELPPEEGSKSHGHVRMSKASSDIIN